MNSAELATNVLSQLESTETAFNPPELDEKGKRNAARMMQEIVCQRLRAGEATLEKQRGSRYLWGDGIILIRNGRVGGGFWTNVPPTQLDDLRRVMADHPAIFLFGYFDPSLDKLHVWAIPDDVAIRTLATIPENQSGMKTVDIKLNEQRIKDADDSPDLRPYYKELALSASETEAFAASIKQDTAAKELDAQGEVEDDDTEAEISDYYTLDSVDFLLELPQHTSDGDWHSANQTRYEQTLRDPSRVLVESLRTNYVARLDLEVAATNRNLSILKKNDYGQGGYQDHYWAAFYDPAAGSKTKSCQLFFRMLASLREFRYGFAFGMHANWAYEDFFEGIKPFTVDGVLKFEPKLGCFLEWIDSLTQHRPNTRHVLVLDEINRCDTAAVLGELLQLLEYRGRSVRLLSGRKFRLPSNVYIIGTMNSADRSIGRMDLALRRRFLWLDLLPDYTVLHTWLSRTGNNPSGFTSGALNQCNQLLEERGIAPEQQIGHALFMIQTSGNESQAAEDKPLIPAALRRIVRYSVLPYVRELCIMQFGRPDRALESQIESTLLQCISGGSQPNPSDDDFGSANDEGV